MHADTPCAPAQTVPATAGFERPRHGYTRPMLYTILIILAIVAILLFIFGRRRV